MPLLSRASEAPIHGFGILKVILEYFLKVSIHGVTLSGRFNVETFSSQLPRYALHIILVGACLVGIWNSWKLARADYLFRQDTADSLRSAIQLEPDAWEYRERLAQLDDGHARELLESALRLNPYDAHAAIELGLRYESAGDYGRSERLLLQAFSMDHTYLPRWSLANFYLRRGNMTSFWAWARKAAEMPSDDIGALFELCWRVSPDAEKIASLVPDGKPEVTRQYLEFLLGKDQLPAAAATAQRLVRTGTPAVDRSQMFSVLNQLIAVNDTADAASLWRTLKDQHWVVADVSAPNNPRFAREPLPVSFDWALYSYSGLRAWPGPSGLEIEFSGNEPESCTIAEQTVMLTPGNYTMDYSYQTSEIPPESGIRWQIVDARSGATLADSPHLWSDTLKGEGVPFSVGRGDSALRLRLIYQRALGTTRISGTLRILSTGIQARTSR
jgi:tetratricopeptide (TPR) repeat protein